MKTIDPHYDLIAVLKAGRKVGVVAFRMQSSLQVGSLLVRYLPEPGKKFLAGNYQRGFFVDGQPLPAPDIP